MGQSRINEIFSEGLRKNIKSNLFTNARLMDNRSLARQVDFEAVNKARLSLYGKESNKIRRMTSKNGEAESIEKTRDTQNGYEVDARSFAIEDSIEKIYFDYYGEGFDGGPIMDTPYKGSYTCPCGLKMMMSAKTLPHECPKCHRLTPLGKLIRDGVIRR